MQGNIITLCGEEGWRILDRQSLREMNFFSSFSFPFLSFIKCGREKFDESLHQQH
jgi:hypothetical protein